VTQGEKNSACGGNWTPSHKTAQGDAKKFKARGAHTCQNRGVLGGGTRGGKKLINGKGGNVGRRHQTDLKNFGE